MKLATFEDIKRILENYYNDLHGKPSTDELNDRLYIEIQNDKTLLEHAKQPFNGYSGGVFHSIELGLMRSINACLTDDDETNGLVTYRNFTTLIIALENVFGADYLDIIRPTYNYYKKGV